MRQISRQFLYPKKALNLTQLKTLAEKLKAKDKSIKTVTFSAIAGDCLIITRHTELF